jgi:hypothetical protein
VGVTGAKHGFATLVYDPIEQGERHQLRDGAVKWSTPREHCRIGTRAVLLGWNTAQFRIWDGIRALDYLVSRSDVDARRVGVLGLSGGGTLSSYLNALENRFCAAAPAGFLSTIRDVIIVASMIEKETAFSGESPTIASVIYNRLTNPGKYPFLNIDATIVYALGGKQDLTAEDLKYDSPYNTYLYEGLPPGPISNPGIYSIRAALNPEKSSFYYYALDTSGESPFHQFFKNYNEHQDFLNSQR